MKKDKIKKDKKINIFLDMDGVLSVYEEDMVKRMTDVNFFRDRKLYTNSRLLFSALKQTDGFHIYILSKTPQSAPTAYQDKMHWLKTHFPEINKQNIYILPNNMEKGSFIAMQFPNCINVLFDDYTPNLIEWEKQGANFIGVKVLNGINGKRGTWTGEKVNLDSFLDIQKKIKDNIIYKKIRSNYEYKN